MGCRFAVARIRQTGGASSVGMWCRPSPGLWVRELRRSMAKQWTTISLIRRRDTAGGKSRHLFHRRSDQQPQSLLEQPFCFTLHLIAIAVRRPCLQLVESVRVEASSDIVPNFAAAEIPAPGDYC